MRTLDAWPQVDPLTARASSTPDRTAVIESETGERWTYEALFDEADWLAGRIETACEGRPDRLGIAMETGIDFVRATHAAWRLGTAIVPLDTREPTEQLEFLAEKAAVDAIVATDRTAEPIADIDGCPRFSVDETDTSGVETLPSHDGGTAPRARYPSDTHLIMFTSGTTGEPAGVKLTLTNLFASAIASAFRLGLTREDRWLVSVPMVHMGGLAPLIRSTLYGTSVVLQREFEPAETAAAIEDFDVTGVSFVPTMLSRLLEAGWSPPESLRFVLLGGAAAPRDLIERSEKAGVPAYPTYGMTETASQVATATPTQAFENPGTVGQPLMFTKVAIIDDGASSPPGETGEIVIDGPTVTPGYLDDDATRRVFDERGLHTGDLGYRDSDGRLYVVGRIDDRIVTGGENVDPNEVQSVIESHPGVAESTVVGIPDEEWGERVGALVVPENGTEPAPDEIESICRDELASFKVPKSIAVSKTIPRTVSGTVDRETVIERIRHG
ncbi:Acyl-CoA synthetase (AMP-forming)/AMP-acid ligase II [Halorhabdus sp. SVX81]|uniref:class I adenylate-forming enzyme family protein n=1 Tax=Halorhabdus sp. SVX81 TaxID=2978283 RepID=UPI0023DAEB2B|nr:AMP-binding protein [Halorhabdus sp. SVX81]WEL17357.1 Acyl-CoA synthetase (AMP-forming)/AMP-acid ligase II [Halorhabdus sp. SVX81]